jgi:phosphoserine phosphatase
LLRTLCECPQLILPVAHKLKISGDRVIANVLHFDAAGRYTHFDRSVPTSRDGGKAEVVHTLKKKHGYAPVVMIGDGSTDMQARPPADVFVGYGGNQVRDKVRDGCDWWVTDFKELLDELHA